MGFLDYLPSIPSISEVGEIGLGGLPHLPSLPSLPSIAEIGEIGITLPHLPSLPSIAEVGEIGLGGLPHLPSLPSLPSLPRLPSIAEVGEIGAVLPSLPHLPSIAEVGELARPIALPDMPERVPLTQHTRSETEAIRRLGATEAERGLDRRDIGANVVGVGGGTDHDGEDGNLFPRLFGGSEAFQEFGRLHDIEAALAEKEFGDSDDFTFANRVTAGVGGAVTTGAELANLMSENYGGRPGTLDSGGMGAAAANSVWEFMGYSTGDYADIEREAIAGHRRA